MTAKMSKWTEVTEIMDKDAVTLGRHLSCWFRETPRRALFYSSYYKFAAKLIGRNRTVLDVGCSEGLGTWILAFECGRAEGIDPDAAAIETARTNWKDPRIAFHAGDFLARPPAEHDAVVGFDVVEGIDPGHEPAFFSRVAANLRHDGIAVVGTPNLEADRFERLEETVRRHFHHVFMFCANDEIVHTGFPGMAHYLIAVGCRKRAR